MTWCEKLATPSVADFCTSLARAKCRADATPAFDRIPCTSEHSPIPVKRLQVEAGTGHLPQTWREERLVRFVFPARAFAASK
mmetsp:Transcript_51135/g.95808  ORF Transcript_51135/g.95808 Transcript_51135/m.95808 type:complete len:82 (+) Transcript_51135:32-277(+)